MDAFLVVPSTFRFVQRYLGCFSWPDQFLLLVFQLFYILFRVEEHQKLALKLLEIFYVPQRNTRTVLVETQHTQVIYYDTMHS